MPELQDILNRFGDSFLQSHTVCYEGIKAIKAIRSCRTAALGGHVDVCEDCGEYHISYNSCRNRNCSKCGNVKKEQWIQDRKEDLLPVRYFHTVFTVPHELNPFFICNLDVMEFIRRFLMHVLPSGFQKIRHYGLLSNRNRNTKLALCKRLTGLPDIREKIKLNARDLILKLKGIDILRCRGCGGNIKRIASLLVSSD